MANDDAEHFKGVLDVLTSFDDDEQIDEYSTLAWSNFVETPSDFKDFLHGWVLKQIEEAYLDGGMIPRVIVLAPAHEGAWLTSVRTESIGATRKRKTSRKR